MSPYTATIIIVKPGAPPETKRLVIDYQELDKQILSYKKLKQNLRVA